jgi:hypothetical protein
MTHFGYTAMCGQTRAAATVTEDDIADLVPCGPDTSRHVQAVRNFTQAGFTHVALVQVGAGQQA